MTLTHLPDDALAALIDLSHVTPAELLVTFLAALAAAALAKVIVP